ncbi:zinc finger protein 501-like isoform X2 [Periplaneta americana]|uniref:zinc finger protein 501-like isoform X2 n=1 Tax=Periplaneta americana TaxID=6978 RepID=UPI0037E7E6A5
MVWRMMMMMMGKNHNQMCPGDGLPSNVCQKCVQETNTAYEFKKKCEASDCKLRVHLRKMQDFQCVTVKCEPLWCDYEQCESNTVPGIGETNSNELWEQNAGYLEPVIHCTVKEEQLDDADEVTGGPDSGLHFKMQSPGTKVEECIGRNLNLETAGSNSCRKIGTVQINSSGTLEENIQSHCNENQFRHKCQICPKIFKRKFQLTEHMCTHTGNLPYKCTYCSKSFARKFSLTDHLNVHSGVKPYVCTLCQKAFARKISLNVHVKTHTASKTFKCEICQKSFTKKVHLADHLRVHSGDQPFVCNICGKAFTHKYSLTVHLRHHRGEKPYVCHCGKAFSQQSHLTVHRRTHTGERPYQCYICAKAFNHNGHLKEHLKVHKIHKLLD